MSKRKVDPAEAFNVSLSVEEVMTLLPHTIEEDAQLSEAGRIFREKKIRHLPVVRKGKLTGILSDRDAHIVSLLPDIAKISVGDVMTANPVTVAGDTPVLEAVAEMVEKKFSCVLVMGSYDDVIGIFTSQDALKLLLGEQKRRFPAPSGFMADSDED